MRFEGILKSWNEDKGFGFLTPAQGGQDIFVHISALPKGTKMPTVGQAFTFEIELKPEGKKRAVKVAFAVRGAPPARLNARAPRRRNPITAVAGMLVVAVIAALIYGKFNGRGHPPTQQVPATEHAQPAQTAPQPATAHQSYRCDGRTHCSQMTSCAEAKFFLDNCPGVQMDGNGDGTPCERQWCSSIFSP